MRLSELPIIDRTREEEFEKWWKDAKVRQRIFSVGFQEYAAIVWTEAWEASLAVDAVKAEVLSEIKAKLFADATSAFLDGDDAEAMLLRRIANEIST